jgi:transglutaminase-like putative cysteine protease
MHLKIHHRTEYHYESPVHYSIQELRLTPPDVTGQKTRKWKLHTPIKSFQSSDPFQNICNVFVQETPYTSMVIEAEGEIETIDAFELCDSSNAVSPYYLLQQTPLTEPSNTMLDYFSGVMPRANQIDAILKLAEAVQEAIPYSPGKTHFATTAAQAFAMQAGVCQDHSHIMLGLCRAANIPARYVSGYFFAEESPNLASHAWIDFCLDISKGQWISVDITHACLIDSRHVRLAVGRDYYSAAPIKGVRSGGGTESLSASISIHQLS